MQLVGISNLQLQMEARFPSLLRQADCPHLCRQASRAPLGYRSSGQRKCGMVLVAAGSSNGSAPVELQNIGPVVITDAAVPEGHQGLHGFLYGQGGAEAHNAASQSYQFREVNRERVGTRAIRFGITDPSSLVCWALLTHDSMHGVHRARTMAPRSCQSNRS